MTLSSVITPGPGGTTMLGERSGLEACARRHIERQKRERHEAEEAAVQKSKVIDDGAISEATLATDSTNTGESTQHRELVINGETKTEDTGDYGEKESKGKWKRFKEHFR